MEKMKPYKPINLDFFNEDTVKECYYITSRTNQILLAFMMDKGYRTVTAFANEIGLSRSRLSQIIHGHIAPNDELKVKIAKKLGTDSLVIFGGRE